MSADLNAKLWDFAYDLLSKEEQAAVKQQICRDPVVAREYTRVMLVVNQIQRTTRMVSDRADFLAELQEGRSWGVAPLAVQAAATTWGTWAVTLLAGGVAALLVFVASYSYWSRSSPLRASAAMAEWDRAMERYPRLLITGPAELPHGNRARYQCLLQRIDQRPLSVELTARLRNSAGGPLWSATRSTDAGGATYFELPETTSFDPWELSITTQHEVSTELDPQAARDDFYSWLTVRDWPDRIHRETYPFQSGERRVQFVRTITVPRRAANDAERTSDGLVHAHIESALTTNVQERRSAADDGQSSARRRSMASGTWLVEGLTFERGRLGNRFLIGLSPPAPREQQPRRQPTAGDSDTAEPIVLYDYTQAPPQNLGTGREMPVATASLPVKFQVAFDRTDYMPGAKATAKLTVSRARAESRAVQLGVVMEEILPATALQLAEQHASRATSSAWTRLSPADVIDAPPLVFDNGERQLKRVEQSFQTWLTHRTIYRQYVSLTLLVGSGIGYAVILLGSLFKRLPPLKIWLPIFGVLLGQFVLGAWWLIDAEPSLPAITLTPLLNYGVRTSPPSFTTISPEERAELPLTAPLQALSETPRSDAHENAKIRLPPARFWSDVVAQRSWNETDPVADGSPVAESTWAFDLARLTNNGWLKFARDTRYDDIETREIAENFVSEQDAFHDEIDTDIVEPERRTPRIVYWHPAVTTDAQGEVALEFTVPETKFALLLRATACLGDDVATAEILVPVRQRSTLD